ncbi:MAG: hypothetical protein ABEJ85_01790 [Haloarculaceae archaeon]
MEERNSPYVYRDEPRPDPDVDADDEEVVISDGRAMTYREYCEDRRTH